MSILLDRVSVRKFQEKEVEPEKITFLLRAAMQAPSSHNQKPWEFYVVTNKEVIAQLSEATPFAKFAKDAPVVFVCTYRKECKIPASVNIDMAACMENICLAAVEQGLGGCWIGVAPLEERMEKVEGILNIPDHLRAFSMYAFGYPDNPREPKERYNEERVHYVK